jgi:hypothetical protein
MRWGWTIWQGTVAHMQQGVNKRSKEKAEVETDALIRCSGVAVAAAVGEDNGTHSDTLTS